MAEILCKNCKCKGCRNIPSPTVVPPSIAPTAKPPSKDAWIVPRAPLSNIREEPNTEPIQSTNPKKKDAAPAAINPIHFSDGTPVPTAENESKSNTETETISKERPMNEPPNSEGKDKENIPPDSSDLPDYTLTEVDKIFDEVFGDHIHQNPGLHLDGGITDDATWQSYW